MHRFTWGTALPSSSRLFTGTVAVICAFRASKDCLALNSSWKPINASQTAVAGGEKGADSAETWIGSWWNRVSHVVRVAFWESQGLMLICAFDYSISFLYILVSI